MDLIVPDWDFSIKRKPGSPKAKIFQKKINKEIIQLWTKIFDYLSTMEREWDQPKTFTNGEYDSQQTKYETLANHLKIAVQAHSTIEGRVLLFALRIIIDGFNSVWIAGIFTDYFYENTQPGDTIPIKDFVKTVSKREKQYSEFFPYGEPITAELSGCQCVEQGKQFVLENNTDPCEVRTAEKRGAFAFDNYDMYFITTKITRQLKDVDLWTFDRIRTVFMKQLNDEFNEGFG